MKISALLISLCVTLPVFAKEARNLNMDCTCIKNIRGECMSFGTGPYPYRQFDEWISGPRCTSGCAPGFSDVYGYSEATKKELAHCYINWTRLRHELGRDNSPWWQW